MISGQTILKRKWLWSGGTRVVWDVLNMIGTVAFAISGAIVAIEEDYDLLGIYLLGFATAFGGGTVRNLLIDLPIRLIWDQGILFYIALIVITIVFLMPSSWIARGWNNKWGVFFDAIGLAAFAIQGAMHAKEIGHPVIACVVAAGLTGVGGGVIRDLLAGRKPLILKKDMYAIWAMIGGLVVGLGLAESEMELYGLIVPIVVCRMLAHHFDWHLPRRKKEETSL